MKQNTKTWIGIIVLVVIIGGSTVLYQFLSKNYTPQNPLGDNTSKEGTSISSQKDSTAEEMVMAPDFSVEDAQGNTVKLSDFIGKPVVLNFWASWCGPCKTEMPDFEKVWKEMGEDITFLMVNSTDGMRETEEKAKKYISEQGLTLPVYYDISQEASYAYGITSLPTTYFIDKDGYIITGAKSMIDEELLRKGIGMIEAKDNPQAPVE